MQRRDRAATRSNGEVIGTLGVIGPTRMAYERVIPIVDVTAEAAVERAVPQAHRAAERAPVARAGCGAFLPPSGC